MTKQYLLVIIYKKTSKGRKKAMKKLVSILLCVAMLCAISVTAFAEGVATTASVSVGSGEAGKGEKITLPLSIKDNLGIASLTTVITYDAAVLSVTDNDVVPAGILDGAVNTADASKAIYQVNTAEAGKIYISFIKTENVTGDGALFNIGFTVKTDAATGDSDISVAIEEMANADASIYNGYTTVNGKVTVTESSVVYGDVDGDSKVTANDALEALQASIGARQLDERATKAADVDKSGDVSANDALCILQFSVGARTVLPVE